MGVGITGSQGVTAPLSFYVFFFLFVFQSLSTKHNLSVSSSCLSLPGAALQLS